MAGDYLVDGARIMAMRRARGLSRRVLADLVGCSEEWLRLVEKGVRPLDRLSTLMRIAGVLRVEDLSELVDGPVALPAAAGVPGHPDGGFGGSADMVLALLLPRRPADDGPVEDVHRVRRRVSAAWEVWRRSPRRYTELRRDLPGLLLTAQATARAAHAEDAASSAGGAPKREAASEGALSGRAFSGRAASGGAGTVAVREVAGMAAAELGRVYRLFATVLRGSGEYAPALLAADRAVSVARGDPVAAAPAWAETAEVLVLLGRPADARRVCLTAADLAAGPASPRNRPYAPEAGATPRSRPYAPEAGATPPRRPYAPEAGATSHPRGTPYAAAVGACLLAAALAAAAEHDLLGVEELLNRARGLAARLPETDGDGGGDGDGDAGDGEDRDGFLVEVDLRAAAAAVRMGRHRQALRLAEGLDPARLTTRDQRVRHFLTLAAAHARDRAPRAAAAMLRKVAESCPEELKHGAQAVRLLAELRLLDCATTQVELRELRELTRLTA
ncbi:helix-turn-helix domain-containing protein [Nonomuraea roseoviolacea]|uniref:Transcriptional regulator with XRE-family HTH domain n=1 Tax=Nonomuraea roseoviolacea subsp. carminata TaxID=160689 RepID=A0ABT1JTX5_9ACTN|nr:helix-turn-helix domain-containing protein [Nonomuraea roseoviolacea]MCP2344721.1 transcriptional regulator with XRE-family HTH domain [Nonomuraea roseoviolacea subsp. carminata]